LNSFAPQEFYVTTLYSYSADVVIYG
jgi:hypothetical protein